MWFFATKAVVITLTTAFVHFETSLLFFSSDGDGLDHRLVILGDGAVVVCRFSGFANSVYHFDALDHVAEAGVLAVKVGAVLVDDEELGGGAVWDAGAGHGDGAAGVEQGIVVAVGLEFADDGVCLLGNGGTALHHETLDDPVEGQAVVEAASGQLHEVIHGDGRGFVIQLHGDGAVVTDHDVGVVGGPAFLEGVRRRGVGAGIGGGPCSLAFTAITAGQDQCYDGCDTSSADQYVRKGEALLFGAGLMLLLRGLGPLLFLGHGSLPFYFDLILS